MLKVHFSFSMPPQQIHIMYAFLCSIEIFCFDGIQRQKQEYSVYFVLHKYISLPPYFSLSQIHWECPLVQKVFAQHISVWTS